MSLPLTIVILKKTVNETALQKVHFKSQTEVNSEYYAVYKLYIYIHTHNNAKKGVGYPAGDPVRLYST